MNRYLNAIMVLLLCMVNLRAEQDMTLVQPIPIVLYGSSLNGKGMEPTAAFIKKYLGEQIYTKNIPAQPGTVLQQAEQFRKEIETDPLLRNGFIVITHSYAGLAIRYYLERYNNPRILTYISYGTPHQGVFGLPGTLDDHFKWLNDLEERAHIILYSHSFQQYIPFASYWHDTLHYDEYLQKSSLLPYLNNEINHEYAELFKYNLSSLHRMILIMSTYEETIEPACSCHFCFYTCGSKTIIEDMMATQIYQKDTLGLKALNESNRLHRMIAQCPHDKFPEDERNFTENVLPFLKQEITVPPTPDTIASTNA